MPDPQDPQRPGALRLIYAYEGDQVRLVSQQRVDVAVPGADLQPVATGDVVEVLGAEDQVLARVAARDVAPQTLEVFGPPGEPITRVDNDQPQGAFTVIVPAPAVARRVVLQRVPDVEQPRVPTDAPPPQGGPTPQGGPDADPTPEPVVLSDDEITE